MAERSDPNRIEHLSEQLRRKRNRLESAAYTPLTQAERLVERVYSAYPEVRSRAGRVEERITDIEKRIMDILGQLDQQSKALLEVSRDYRRMDEEMANKAKLSMQLLRFLPSVIKRGLFPTLALAAVGAWQARKPNEAGETPRDKWRILDTVEFLRQAADKLLASRVSFVQDDPRAAELLGKLENGTSDEKAEARQLLAETADALQVIAKSQHAYDVYTKFGNVTYAEEQLHAAAEAREKLRQIGISSSYYDRNADLRKLFGQDPLAACDYNPLMNDRSSMPEHEELLGLLRGGLENGLSGPAEIDSLRVSYDRAAQQIELERQQTIIDEYLKTKLPPTHLPDGTPITEDNKVNETTYAYFEEHVLNKHEDYMHVNVPYTAYDAWVKETYGRTGWEQAVHVSDVFIRSLGEEIITGVIDLGGMVVELVIDPVQALKDTGESLQQTAAAVEFFAENPDKLIEVAEKVYADFDSMSPEEKADALGALASTFIPGANITKVGKIDNMMDGLNNLQKKVDDNSGGSGDSGGSNGSPGGDDDNIRETVFGNIYISQQIREMSRFDEYLTAEKELYDGLKRPNAAEGKNDFDYKEWADMPVSGQVKLAPNGQRLISIRELKRFTKNMSEKNIKVVIDEKGKILPSFAAGGFDPKTGQIVLKKEPTYLSTMHESYHAKQWLEIGKEEYLKLSTLEREEYVYNQIMKNKDLYTSEEILFSQRYIYKLKNGEWPPPVWRGFE
ncbi:zincin-like metallopeptidase toxin domain-containing protein [Paenibacillus soyae]|uniref:Tox-MPTase4 domain-containing protein n=1 Tax=Paenibacillus soyae TaxID=2969249 RepID=A0A9X2MMH9_9BACL|nr:zincin-like metallopeptidase toxin domain-containing protein [Paenibacillus soyae]MCR2803396.1 hypothetical protein [Paenibacillus soyae]